MSIEERGSNEKLLDTASPAELPIPEASEPAAASRGLAGVKAEAADRDGLEPDKAANDIGNAVDLDTEAASPPAESDDAAAAVTAPATTQPADADSSSAAQAVAAEQTAVEALSDSDPGDVSQAEGTAAEDEAAEEPAEAAAVEAAPSEDAEPAKEEPKYKRGQVISGIISQTTPTAVTVDFGDGDEGIVPGRELELMTRKMLESLTVGAQLDVYVVNPRNHRGETLLSINLAMEELDWRNAKKLAKSRKTYEAQVGGYNKGGLIVRFGRLRGFVPQSQLAEDRVRGMTGETPEERYGPMVNQPIGLKVMEVDRRRNRLILSERAASRDVRQRRKESLIAELKVGEIRRGRVVSLENFGAFVDIGGGEGLIHLSELAWGHITHPRQAVSIGDEVEVEVINVNQEQKRIGLSRKRVIRDPWDEIATTLRRGQLVRGRVTKLTKFGAFARLIDQDAVEGLIHISELSAERVTHPSEAVRRGEELVLRIVKIDIRERRLGLSLKSVNSTEFLDLDWEMAIQDAVTLPPATPPPAETEAAADEAETPTEEAGND